MAGLLHDLNDKAINTGDLFRSWADGPFKPMVAVAGGSLFNA
jgi:hypothetical protein